MVISTSSLICGLVFGSVGMAYWVYGKKRHKSGMLWAGVSLMVYPYFVENLWLSIVIGAALFLLPFFYRD